MYHKDGILVHLEAQGKKIKESAYLNGQDPADTNSKDTRARISEEFNTPFTVELELTKDFRPFSAEAIKLTIAIGHSEQTPEDLDDVQAWHIPLDLISMSRFTINQQRCWSGDSSEPVISEIRIPAPEGCSNDT